MKDAGNKKALLLEEAVDGALINVVVEQGYAPDLTDDEPTVEASAPRKKRKNRKIPDVCNGFGLQWCNPFTVNRRLGFKTGWKR
jgi:hypothetical protein